jgi:NAD(P)H-hydrate epimerase
MLRKPTSHKGENGMVAVIGGSLHQHGAPLFSALAAEASGVDLIYVFVPLAHCEVAKSTSLNFQVHTFGTGESDLISSNNRADMLELLATMDSAVIGPGLALNEKNVQSILELLEGCPCPVVIDATALQPRTLKCVQDKNAVLTPHLGELERMGLKLRDLPEICKITGCTFLVKGPADTIIDSNGNIQTIEGGNAGLTVGGTGDVLAGVIAGLLAQKEDPAEACRIASTVVKRAGDVLMAKKGFAFTARDVTLEIPMLLKQL